MHIKNCRKKKYEKRFKKKNLFFSEKLFENKKFMEKKKVWSLFDDMNRKLWKKIFFAFIKNRREKKQTTKQWRVLGSGGRCRTLHSLLALQLYSTPPTGVQQQCRYSTAPPGPPCATAGASAGRSWYRSSAAGWPPAASAARWRPSPTRGH